MITKLWKVVLPRVTGLEWDGTGHWEWDTFATPKVIWETDNFIIMNLAQWHGKLLKGLIDYSVRAVPENMKNHIKCTTDPAHLRYWMWMQYLDFGSPAFQERHQQSYDIHGQSMYGDDDYQETARIQENETRKILHILATYGFPI